MEAHRRWVPTVLALATLLAAAPPAGAGATSRVLLRHSPVGVVMLASLGTLATASENGTVDTFDRSLHLQRSRRVCAEARWIVAGDVDRRLFVGCRDRNAAADDDRGELVVLDARDLTVIARVPEISTLTAAAIDASPRRLAYVRRRDGALARIEPGSGHVVDAISVSGESGDRFRLIPGDAGTPMFALDGEADRVIAVGRDGTPRTYELGRRRGPSAAVLDGPRLLVAQSGAGTLAALDLARPDPMKTIPAGDTPMQLALDRPRGRILVLCRRLPESDSLAVVSIDERAQRRVLATIPRLDDAPYPIDTPQMELDAQSARLIVATKRRIDIVTPDGISRPVGFPEGLGIVGFTLDRARGEVYVVVQDADRGEIERIAIRGNAPVRAADRELLPLHERRGSSWALGMYREGEPAIADPQGRRSPASLAVGADGSLIVADLLSPTLGTFAVNGGTYREDPIQTSAAPQVLATDRNGDLWFSEARVAAGKIAHRRRDGTIEEIALPSFATKIVVADDGVYWIATFPEPVLGRVARDGSLAVRTIALPPAWTGRRMLLDVAAAPGGGCYALFDDRLVLVRPDGTTSPFPEFSLLLSLSLGASSVTALPDGAVAVAIGHMIVRYDRNRARRLYWPIAQSANSFETQGSARCRFDELIAGDAGSIWGVCGETIVSISPSGRTRAVVPPVPQSMPRSLVRAPDGSIWFAEPAHSALGRIAPDGTISEYPL